MGRNSSILTKDGENVLDPMAEPVDLVAALRAGRNSYGVELNPIYAKSQDRSSRRKGKLFGEKVEGLTSRSSMAMRL